VAAHEVDLGELLFERYLSARGYVIQGREEDFGAGRRPDYRIGAGGRDVVAEVKTFDPLSELPPARVGGFVGSQVKAVRDRISDGARQLRGVGNLPVMVVLASPLDALKPLHPAGVIEAMYGDQLVYFNNGRGITFGAGRNGKLRVDEDGRRVRGSHRHLSAVAVIRCSDALQRAMWVWMAGNSSRFGSDKAAFVAGLEQIEVTSADQELVQLDVFEVLSSSAIPLPRTVFDGPLDTRWGKAGLDLYGDPYYGRLTLPPVSETAER